LWLPWLLLVSVRAPADPLGRRTDPVGISGGNIAAECQFPGVVAFRAGDTSCSGSIVHPRVMITAAHCLADGTPDRIRFGESYSGWERRSDVERCEADPAYADSEHAADDIGYCVLVDPVDDLAPVPVLAGCETQHLQIGTITAIVGFGLEMENGSFGRKRYAFTTVADELRADGTIVIGDAGANGCIGDSGGPALVELPDGTWRVAGLFSHGPACGGGPNTFRVLADRVTWIEERSGFDITPCFDDDGVWSPSAECDAFDADPRLSEDGWEHFCDGPRITPSATCASPLGETSSGSGATSSSGGSSGDTNASAGDTTTSSMLETTSGEGCGCTADPDRPRGDFSVWMWGAVLAFALRSEPRARKRARACARSG
jgi:MYXO-CTERM domain-containing protein